MATDRGYWRRRMRDWSSAVTSRAGNGSMGQWVKWVMGQCPLIHDPCTSSAHLGLINSFNNFDYFFRKKIF